MCSLVVAKLTLKDNLSMGRKHGHVHHKGITQYFGYKADIKIIGECTCDGQDGESLRILAAKLTLKFIGE